MGELTGPTSRRRTSCSCCPSGLGSAARPSSAAHVVEEEAGGGGLGPTGGVVRPVGAVQARVAAPVYAVKGHAVEGCGSRARVIATSEEVRATGAAELEVGGMVRGGAAVVPLRRGCRVNGRKCQAMNV